MKKVNMTKLQPMSFSFSIFFQKILALKVIFLHRRVKISTIFKSNKFFLLGTRNNFFFLNSFFNFKTLFRASIFFKFFKFLNFKFCFLSFEKKYKSFIHSIAALLKAFCISGEWFHGFFSRFMYQRFRVFKKFHLFNFNQYTDFFPDIAIFIGNYKNIISPLNELFVFNIPTITITDLFFPCNKTNYFFICDLYNLKFVYFYIRLIICLIDSQLYNKNDTSK